MSDFQLLMYSGTYYAVTVATYSGGWRLVASRVIMIVIGALRQTRVGRSPQM